MAGENLGVIKQLIPAEPGWYLEDGSGTHYDYYRVICWALVEQYLEGKKTQIIQAVIDVDISVPQFIDGNQKVVFAPSHQVGKFSLKKSLRELDK